MILPTTLLRNILWRQQVAVTIFLASSGLYLIAALYIWNLAPRTPKAFSEQRLARDNLKRYTV